MIYLVNKEWLLKKYGNTEKYEVMFYKGVFYK